MNLANLLKPVSVVLALSITGPGYSQQPAGRGLVTAVVDAIKSPRPGKYFGIEIIIDSADRSSGCGTDAVMDRIKNLVSIPITANPQDSGVCRIEFSKPADEPLGKWILFRVRQDSSVLSASLTNLSPRHRLDFPASDATLPAARFNRLIIKFRDDEAVAASRADGLVPTPLLMQLVKATGVELRHFRAMSDDAFVISLPEGLSDSEKWAVVNTTRNLSVVEYCDPDYIVERQAVPSDPYYPLQPHLNSSYPASISAPTAWNITTGSNRVTVAVIDSGIVPHPDLAGRILPGWDFISDPASAGDGDGRDSDPTDEGTFCAADGSGSSWHGTHVAGIIGANGNNGIGITGIDWGARILPIRVLGRCGTGGFSDIADAVRWAAGTYATASIPRNWNPARVINMSLGGPAPCSSSMQAAINAAVSAGSAVVVAAANKTQDVENYAPANCQQVVSVGSVRLDGNLAWYSNYGTKVEISAPGGDAYYGLQVYSTVEAGSTVRSGSYSYKALQGTSMAAPIVSGTMSLMLAINPNLTPAQLITLIQGSARRFPSGTDCVNNFVSACGAGMLDAGDAVAAAVEFSKPRPQGSISSLDFLPLLPYNAWSYIDDGGVQETYRVAPSVSQVNGIPATAVAKSATTASLYTNDLNGLRRHAEYDELDDGTPVLMTFNPPVTLIAGPVAELGKVLATSGTFTIISDALGNQPLQGKFGAAVQPIQFEVKATPAGSFYSLTIGDALIIELDSTFSLTQFRLASYAQGLGLVALDGESQQKGGTATFYSLRLTGTNVGAATNAFYSVSTATAYNIPAPTNVDQPFLRLYNTSSSNGKVRGTLYGQDGIVLGNADSVISDRLLARSVKILTSQDIANIFGVATWTGRAWLKLEADFPDLKVMNLIRSNLLLSMSCLNSSGAYYIPAPSDPLEQAFVRLYNPTSSTSEVRGTLYATGGEIIGVPDSLLATSVPANGVTVINATQIAAAVGVTGWTGKAWLAFSKSPSNMRVMNTLRDYATNRLMNVSCTTETGNSATSADVLNLPAPDSQTGSEIRIYNTGSQPANIRGTVYSEDGASLGVFVKSSPLPAKGVSVPTVAQISQAIGRASWPGRAWIRVTSDVPGLRVLALTRQQSAGEMSCWEDEYAFNIPDAGNPVDKPFIRLYNTGETPIQLTGTLYHQDGYVLGTENATLVQSMAPHSVVQLSAATLAGLVGTGPWSGRAWLKVANAPAGLKILDILEDQSTGNWANMSCVTN